MDELQSLKLEAVDERHDLERLLTLWDQYREYMEGLGNLLIGSSTPDALRPS
jgi:hypothetical protein